MCHGYTPTHTHTYKNFYLFIVSSPSPKIILTHSRHSIIKINIINTCCMNEWHSFCQRWLRMSSKFRKHIMVQKFPKGFLFLIFWNSRYSNYSHCITHLMLAFARFTRGHRINVELFLTCVSSQEKCMSLSPPPCLGLSCGDSQATSVTHHRGKVIITWFRAKNVLSFRREELTGLKCTVT